MYQYKAKVLRVVDGDTIDAEVDLGFNLFARLRFRFRGVDTPETHRPSCTEEYNHGIQAKAFVENLIPVGTIVNLFTYKEGAYNRWEADVQLTDGRFLTPMIISNGLVKKESYK